MPSILKMISTYLHGFFAYFYLPDFLDRGIYFKIPDFCSEMLDIFIAIYCSFTINILLSRPFFTSAFPHTAIWCIITNILEIGFADDILFIIIILWGRQFPCTSLLLTTTLYFSRIKSAYGVNNIIILLQLPYIDLILKLAAFYNFEDIFLIIILCLFHSIFTSWRYYADIYYAFL